MKKMTNKFSSFALLIALLTMPQLTETSLAIVGNRQESQQIPDSRVPGLRRDGVKGIDSESEQDGRHNPSVDHQSRDRGRRPVVRKRESAADRAVRDAKGNAKLVEAKRRSQHAITLGDDFAQTARMLENTIGNVGLDPSDQLVVDFSADAALSTLSKSVQRTKKLKGTIGLKQIPRAKQANTGTETRRSAK